MKTRKIVKISGSATVTALDAQSALNALNRSLIYHNERKAETIYDEAEQWLNQKQPVNANITLTGEKTFFTITIDEKIC